MENYLSQVDVVDEVGDFLAQTYEIEDENLAAVADYLAQLDEEDLELITNHLAQQFEEDSLFFKDVDGVDEYAQIGAEEEDSLFFKDIDGVDEYAQIDAEDDDDILPKVASFLVELSEEDIGSMENYLIQLEQAAESGDSDTLAQLGSSLDENFQTVADYLVQLDDNELA